MAKLLDNVSLESSSIVANSLMNRERNCTGGNSYERELSLNPIEFLTQRLQTQNYVLWLDICCGTGRALIEAAAHFQPTSLASRVHLVGIDLVPMFLPYEMPFPHLQLAADSIPAWRPNQAFDLITCVHGLHYIGDKLFLLQKVASWLKPDGFFIGHLDPTNLRLANQGGTTLLRELCQIGFQYNTRKHLLSLSSRIEFELPYKYIGADDEAGPNYTGQAAINSYYEPCP